MNDTDLIGQSPSRLRRFPKSARICDSKAFLRLLQVRKRVDGCLEMAFVRSVGGGARLGVIVSRRFLPRAVDRNTVKRIVREAFRLQCAELPDGDVLIRLRQSLKERPAIEWRGEIAAGAGNLLGSIK